MKGSYRISLGLVPIVAAAFAASCADPQRRACVDPNGVIVGDINCANQPVSGQPQSGAAASGATGTWNTPGAGGFYRWYWYRGSSAPFIGAHVPAGGGYTAPAAHSGTTRGGFGSTAAGHSSSGA